MVASNKALLARMQRGGIGSVTPAAGLAVLSTLLSRRTPPAAQVWPAMKFAARMTGLQHLPWDDKSKMNGISTFYTSLDCCPT